MSLALITIVKVVVSMSLFFIWVVRYDNIVEEFQLYGLPDKLRDLVGILKLSIAVLIHSSVPQVVSISLISLGFLMVCALLVHIRVKNSYSKMVPALSIISLITFLIFSSDKSFLLTSVANS